MTQLRLFGENTTLPLHFPTYEFTHKFTFGLLLYISLSSTLILPHSRSILPDVSSQDEYSPIPFPTFPLTLSKYPGAPCWISSHL